MAELAPATTVIVIHGGMSVPVDEYKKVDGLSPELRYAIAKFFDTSQAFATSYITDPPLRADYQRRIRAAADEIMEKVVDRELTPHEGAQQANAYRNQILKLMRAKSTAVGQSVAEELKPEGKSMSQMQEKYALQKYGKQFDALGEIERNNVWAEIVDSAGRSNRTVNTVVRFYGVAGRAFLIATLAVAIYDVYTAKDKERQAAKEAASLGASIATGAAVVAGLGLMSVGAPIVLMSVLVAGVLASTESDRLFDYFWPER